MKYKVAPFARGKSFNIVNIETGCLVFDSAPYGQDKPLLFHDEDKADEVCENLNKNYESFS